MSDTSSYQGASAPADTGFTPFQMALAQQASQRGYNPAAIAALIGNSQQENGGRTGGPAGDGGISVGGFQWNAGRRAALQNGASNAGVSWTDPNYQAKFTLDELDGPESKAGRLLKSAQDATTANMAMMNYLRPAGWTPRDPTGGDSYAKRLAYSQAALAHLSGQNPALASADSPAPGAAPVSMQGQPDQSGFAVPGQGNQGGSFLGGLGAALGLGGGDQDRFQPLTLGDRLTRAGIAAMARDNPSGASAMAQIPAMEARSYQRPFSLAGYNQASGKAVIFNNRSGQSTQQQVGSPFYQVPEGQVKEFDENNEHINTADNAMTQLKNVRDMVMNGQLDPSIFARGQSYLNGLAGSSNPNDLAIYNAVHNISIAHNDLLKQHTGTQTDKDSEEAFKTIMPGNAEYDKGAFVQAINNVLRAEGATMASNIQSQSRKLGVYGHQLTGGDDTYANRYNTVGSKWNDIVNKDIPQSNAWAEKNAQGNAATSAAPTAPAPKYSGGGSTTSTGGSISPPSIINRQTGHRMIVKDGKWQDAQ